MRQVDITLRGVERAKASFDRHQFVFVRHFSEVILVTHGNPDGSLPYLDKALKTGTKFDAVICCFPIAVRHAHPEYKVLGDVNTVTPYRWTSDGIRIWMAS